VEGRLNQDECQIRQQIQQTIKKKVLVQIYEHSHLTHLACIQGAGNRASLGKWYRGKHSLTGTASEKIWAQTTSRSAKPSSWSQGITSLFFPTRWKLTINHKWHF